MTDAELRQLAYGRRVVHVDHRDGQLGWARTCLFVHHGLVGSKGVLIWILCVTQTAPGNGENLLVMVSQG